MLIENAVVYMKSTLFTMVMSRSIFFCSFFVRIVVVYMRIALFTNILTQMHVRLSKPRCV